MVKKIWAYAKNKQNDFIRGQHSSLRKFYIWEVLKIKQNFPEKYNELTFYSTQTNESNRSRMTPVKNGFFKYTENMKGGNNQNGDNESISHSVAISVLSELKKIKFVIGQECYHLNFSHFQEGPRLQFENGHFYFPDLIGYFDSECELASKWNGKVAIEVVVNHKCEPQKIKDFFNHNIPIIEVYISEKIRFLKEVKKQIFDSTDVENYNQFLTKTFTELVYGRIVSDPSSDLYYQKQLDLKEEELKSYIKQIQLCKQEKNDISDKYKKIEEDLNFQKQNFLCSENKLEESSRLNQELLHKYKEMNEMLNIANENCQSLEIKLVESERINKELQIKLQKLESMSWWEKLKSLF
ncbi:hypothetical protein [Snodgrassella alvi]|uniref:hypothetical protein n=1 Tax=Snodgrassella alvi TaxID=1196083 RepID=UPI000C1F0545|nr:hypothetical protein [Snodgrassella alvi]PIT46246.1 hypothetical protein BHC51_07115 [Snodgrassella alvi]